MRGVVSAGMLTALEYLGLLPTFDVIYGTSAGAINGAFFIAGQAAYGTTIYYENINNSSFIDLSRLLRGKAVVSLEFLFDEVMVKEKILDWQKVVESDIELVPVATSVTRAAPVLLRGLRSRDELFLRLKASARIPFFAGPPIRIGDEVFVDGGLFASIPHRQAAEEGCTHILALLTRPSGAVPNHAGFLDKHIFPAKLAQYNPALRQVISERMQHYASDVKWLAQQTSSRQSRPYILAVQPSFDAKPVARLEKRRKFLIAGAKSGLEAIMSLFAQPGISSTEVIYPYRASGQVVTGPD